jgi:sugar porter (SP) family MFS transporter
MKGFAMISASLGVLGGLTFAGGLADRIGRKNVLIIAAVLFGISAVGSALPESFLIWNIYRILGGVGGGLAAMVSPMYIAEVAPARMRGRLVLLNQLAIVISALTAAVICYILARTLDDEPAWRWMYASELVPILFLMVTLPFIPRSPRWLITKGREAEGRAVLARIDGEAHAEQEVTEIRRALEEEHDQGSYFELLNPGVRRALLIAVALAAFQQLGGVSTLTFYLPSIMQEAGIAVKADSIYYSIGNCTWVLVMTIVAMLLVDKVGRRPLLLIGTAGMFLGQFLMGLASYVTLSPNVLLLIILGCNTAYIISLAPLAWLIMSEIFPTRLRAKGMAIANLFLQLSAMGVNGLFPAMMSGFEESFGNRAPGFWLFALICLAAFVFSLVLVPETKGKTLEEISRFWTGPGDQKTASRGSVSGSAPLSQPLDG